MRICFGGAIGSHRGECGHSAVATLSHNDCDGASSDIGQLGAQAVDLAVNVVKPRMHIELNIPQLPGDESKLTFELRQSRFGQGVLHRV